jgi:hypothetical protein
VDEIQVEVTDAAGQVLGTWHILRGVGLVDLTGGPDDPLPDPALVEAFRAARERGELTRHPR